RGLASRAPGVEAPREPRRGRQGALGYRRPAAGQGAARLRDRSVPLRAAGIHRDWNAGRRRGAAARGRGPPPRPGTGRSGAPGNRRGAAGRRRDPDGARRNGRARAPERVGSRKTDRSRRAARASWVLRPDVAIAAALLLTAGPGSNRTPAAGPLRGPGPARRRPPPELRAFHRPGRRSARRARRDRGGDATRGRTRTLRPFAAGRSPKATALRPDPDPPMARREGLRPANLSPARSRDRAAGGIRARAPGSAGGR